MDKQEKLNPQPKAKEELTPEKSWTRITDLFCTLDKYWKEHRDLMLVNRGKSLEGIPIDIQKHLAMNFNIASLDIALPRIVNYWRSQGGIHSLVPKGVKKNG